MTSGCSRSFLSESREGGHWIFNLNGRGEIGESKVRIESLFFTEISDILYLKSHIQGVAIVATAPSPWLQSLIVDSWISSHTLQY